MPSGMALLRLGLALGQGYGAARLSGPLLRTRGRLAAWSSWLAATALLFLPLLIPASAVVWRAVGAVACTEWMFKMLDYRRNVLADSGDASPADRSRYSRFLVPIFPPFLVSWDLYGRRPPAGLSRMKSLQQLAVGTMMAVAGFLVLALRSRFSLPAEHFVVDHAIVFAAFIPTIEGISLALLGLEHLAGFGTSPLVRGILRSRTPAEFWLRYNTRVHRWLRENLFLPAGGVRRPGRGIVLTFLYSAALHEGMFAIATSVLDGRQFAFFALQAPAVLLSPALERFARRGGLARKFIAHGVTILWFYVTSMLFFHGVQRVFPFLYVHPL